MNRVATTLVLLVLTASGCVIGNERYQRPRDLPDSSTVDRPRVLAIQADPPEVEPGASVAFSALIADPFDELDGSVWIACLDGGGFGCPVDLAGLSEEPTPEELQAAGVIGFTPGFEPVWQVPSDALDALTEAERLEGLSATVQVASFPAASDGGEEVDFNDVEVAYKRLVVSEALTPNQNPTLSAWRVEGALVPQNSTVIVDPGQTYDLSVELGSGSVEEYLYVNSAGEEELRTEEPYLSWYGTSGGWPRGSITVPLNGFDVPLETSWTAPMETGAGEWFVVIRDRRGGQAWLTQTFEIQ
jgi:hypothetical protein